MHVQFFTDPELTSVRTDSPLPDARIPNGSALNGPVRSGSWGTGHWSNIQPSIAAASLGKPPLGRDPKSRARSRDYLKQCVCSTLCYNYSFFVDAFKKYHISRRLRL